MFRIVLVTPMDATRFDNLLRSHANAPSRRGAVQLLATLAAAGLTSFTSREKSAAKKHKSRKAALCLNGQTVFVGKKAKKSLLNQGATAGACLTPPAPPPPPVCTRNCAGKQCGPDACGSQCGACTSAQTCQSGTCVVVCIPQCNGNTCGPNGCGGQCGECAGNNECQDGRCCEPCLADGSCCPEGQRCLAFAGGTFCEAID
jgi:hypothetical protein